MQFVKAQIGVRPRHPMPTASISGAENAAASAHKFRAVHKTDPNVQNRTQKRRGKQSNHRA
jgi:hypothetical protein